MTSRLQIESDDLVYDPATGEALDVIPASWFGELREVESAPEEHVQAPLGERLLTAQEAARYVGCHANTIYDAAKSGRLSFRAIGRLRRFTVNDLDAWTRRES